MVYNEASIMGAMQLETEWLRSDPNVAGVLAFCYLENNYG
jgi:hypothetical protein